jgi:hypothetical protein
MFIWYSYKGKVLNHSTKGVIPMSSTLINIFIQHISPLPYYHEEMLDITSLVALEAYDSVCYGRADLYICCSV